MKAVFLGKNKPYASRALRYLHRRGVEIAACVGPERTKQARRGPRLIDTADSLGIPTATDDHLYAILDGEQDDPRIDLSGVDVVISYLFWKLIKPPLINLGRVGCVNFHPAPLPEFRGLGLLNFALMEGVRQWGVSAHFVDETFDTGDIIRVYRFDIDPRQETALSLDERSQRFMFDLFRGVVDDVIEGRELPRQDQGDGSYYSRQSFEEQRKIRDDDDLETVERKIRAFWYPPYRGATIRLRGKDFTVVDDRLLEEIARAYWSDGGD